MIIGTLLALFAVLALLAIGIRFWKVREEEPAATKDISANSGTPFPRRRRRRAGFGGSPNPKFPIVSPGLPSSSGDGTSASNINQVASERVDGNGGIMNDGFKDEDGLYLDDPVLIESPSRDDRRQLHGSDFV